MPVSGVITLSAISTGRALYLFSGNWRPSGWFYLPNFTEELDWVSLGFHELMTCKKPIMYVVDELQIYTDLSLYVRQSSPHVILSKLSIFSTSFIKHFNWEHYMRNNIIEATYFTTTLLLFWFLQGCTSDSSAVLTRVFLTCRKGFTFL